ncbi:MAG TPA: FG-GAP-like repeat-containing protein [Anaerolineae bacterium]|nr:FG-GAP-like repeat-containing protein [Anaerolineae bacterium]
MNRPILPAPARATMLVGLLLVVGACKPSAPGPLPTLDLPADRYEQLVSAYFGGVAALQVGDTTSRGKDLLTQASELAPEEPAILADLALYHLRNQGADTAADLVAKARKLAPQESRLALLDALVADRRGKPEDAVKVLREAVALDGANLRARYALKEAIERAGAADADAAVASELDAILAVSPQNPAALLDRARLAAKAGDGAAATTAIQALGPLAAAWPPDVRDQLAQVQAAQGGDVKALVPRLAVLQNLLLPTPAYQVAIRALRLPDDVIGEPIGAFLRLPMPRPQADAPDMALAFGSEPIDAPAIDITVLPLGEEGAAATVLDLGGAARILDGSRTAELAFPSLSVRPNDDATAAPVRLLALDWNNDKRMDLAACGVGGLLLYRADAASYTDVTVDSGLTDAVLKPACTGAWTADIELDGDMDLLLGQGADKAAVLRNNGDGSWLAVEASDLGDLSDLRQLVWADLDSDGDADLAAIAGERLTVLDNRRNGSFAPQDLGAAADAAALLAADVDGDGWLDLLTLAADGAVAARRADPATATAGAPAFGAPEELRPAVGSGAACRTLLWGDVDNNGAADLVVGCDQPAPVTRVSLNDGQGAWQDLPLVERAAARALADLDGDGKLDLVGMGDAAGTAAIRLTNQGGAKDYHYQVLRLRGLEIPPAPPGQSGAQQSGDQRINSFGLGGLVSIRSGLLTQTRLIDGPALHFGLGSRGGVETAHIYWPNGLPQGEFDLEGDAATTALQRLKGSCPWLFADDGSRIAFVTDILWKSPLGLRINAVDTAGVVQTEDWVKVRGDQLAAKDGFYDLRITAELWETHFFDLVSLLVVDHPEGTETFVDERFSIPPPPLAVQTTGPLFPVDRALDQEGRDVSDRVAARDEVYLDSFALGAYQGIAQDHWVEVDLTQALVKLQSEQPASASDAAASSPPALALYATGFIYPTDSSINVAIGQGKAVAPQDLSIEVPDGKGGWRTAKARQGFPAGKHKSLLLPLAGLDPDGAAAPERLRLRTNLEVYWDQLALVALVPGEEATRTQRLAAESAQLRYRGLSVTSHTGDDPAPHAMPEIPDYSRVTTTVPWLNLGGFYTRFGDVKPLLEQVDDRYVILNAGDEILLRFKAPADPPAGWVRDFVFISDGWEKDGDFNTAYGETVLPLPAHDKPEYADPRRLGAVGSLQDDPVYQAHPQDWIDYHTRFVPPQRLNRPLQALPAGR